MGPASLTVWAAGLAVMPTWTLGAEPALAPRPLAVTIEGNVTATDNGAFDAPGQERHDLITSVRPRVTMAHRGAGLEFNVDASATFLNYANGTQQGGVLPDINGSLKATVVDRLLFIDAAARLHQAAVDPFGSQANDTGTTNRRTAGTYRVSPSLEHEVASNTSFLARHDVTLSTNGAGDAARQVSNYSLIRLDRNPVPLGAAVELTRLDDRTTGTADSNFTLDTARLRASIALFDEVVLGVAIGRDRTKWLQNNYSDPVYGGLILWKPGPRTELLASLDHRYFGSGGDLSFRHRLPWMSFALTMNRQPVTSSTSRGALGQSSDIRSFLDAILTTRYQDPTVRSGVVDSLITSRGLDMRVSSPNDVVAEYPQLQTSVSATWVMLGTRNTTTLDVYARSARQLTRDGDLLAVQTPAISDNRQVGGSIQFNRRLTSQLNVDAAVRWAKITGLSARAGEDSEERNYRLSLTQSVSPRTGLSAGIQRTQFTTTATGQHSFHATLVYMGINHRL